MGRIAALYAPGFPLQAALRAEPDLEGAPLAVTQGVGPRALVVALSEKARAAGVRLGMTLTQATAAHNDLVSRPASEAAARSAEDALVDVARAFAIKVEQAAQGLVYLEVGDLRRLFPRETGLAAALEAAARKLGLRLRIGIAATKSTARLAALCSADDAATIVPAGEERAFVARLPVRAAEPGPELGRALTRFGLHTLGEVAALPVATLARRLGREGARLAALARAEDHEPLRANPEPESFVESVDLEYYLDASEPLAFVLLGAVGRMCRRMEARGLACAGLTLTLRLAPRGTDAREVVIAAPTIEAPVLVALARLSLEERPPPAQVRGVAVSGRAVPARPAQLPLFGPVTPAPDRLAATVAKLAALCGGERVGAPAVVDSNRPEAEAVVPFAPPPPPATSGLTEPEPPPRVVAVRRVQPSRPVSVRTRADDVPVALEGEPLRHVAGPWRVGGEWWSESPFARDYWDVETRAGTLYRAYRDGEEGGWFIDAIYD